MNNDPLVLIIDDIRAKTKITEHVNYTVIHMSSEEDVIGYIKENVSNIALILLNILQGKESEILAIMKHLRNGNYKMRPTLVVFAPEENNSLKMECLKAGAKDFWVKPFDQELIVRKVENLVEVYRKEKTFYNLLIDQIKERNEQVSVLIFILSQIIRQTNDEGGDHILHIGLIMRILLETLRKIDNLKYDISDEDLAAINIAACLHDIGKVKVPLDILNKQGKLTDEEFAQIKKHTIYGYEMLEEYTLYTANHVLTYAKDICRWHHERYDGTGYPDGLKGDEIPIWSQVAAIADCYDALTSDRCYKEAIPHEQAIQMIMSGQCGVFNKDVLAALLISADKIYTKLHLPNTIDVQSELDAQAFADSMLRKLIDKK